MSPSEKRRFIKDPVWGQVEFFPWERILFRHELVNRLHGICQNSCTFKVYPALRYSRFSHSIGALHVATQLFVNIARNLEVVARSGESTEQRNKAKRASQQFANEIAAVEKRFKGCDRRLRNQVREVLARSFPIRPHNALALLVVRLGALLHDCGHLPYSHLFEHTLEAFIAYKEKQLASSPPIAAPESVDYVQSLDTPGRRVVAETRKLRDGLRKVHWDQTIQNPGLTKFHELLGYQFATLIAHSLVEIKEDNPLRELLRVAVEVARDVWARKLTSAKQKGCATPILSSLLSGHIDADRIDFVHRDSYFSGLFRCSVDSRRLFDLYEAAERRPGVWQARPSCRSTADAGKLLIERYQLYKYIVAHHRVHLFDELLERCLLVLLSEGKLNDFLKALIGLLKMEFGNGDYVGDVIEKGQLRRKLLYIDDSWVDVKIRERYADFSHADGDDDERKKTLFQALLESRGRLHSVFKWDPDFDSWWEKELAVRFRRNLAKSASRDCAKKILDRFRDDLVWLLDRRRYQLEDYLQEKAKLPAVIVGVTGRKVRAHTDDVEEASFFGLGTVNSYLRTLTRETMVFNLWFAPKQDPAVDRENILQHVLAWLEQNVLPDVIKIYTSNDVKGGENNVQDHGHDRSLQTGKEETASRNRLRIRRL